MDGFEHLETGSRWRQAGNQGLPRRALLPFGSGRTADGAAGAAVGLASLFTPRARRAAGLAFPARLVLPTREVDGYLVHSKMHLLFEPASAWTGSPGRGTVRRRGGDAGSRQNRSSWHRRYPAPRIPAFAAQLDPGLVQLHSSEYRDTSQLRDGGVLVVGAANSGAEIALEVSRNHRTWLSGRHPGQEPFRPGSGWDRLLMPVVWLLVTHVLTVKTPFGRMVRGSSASRLPLARVRQRNSPPRDRRVPDGGGRGPAGARRLTGPDVTNVIWCTVRAAFTWIDLPASQGRNRCPNAARGRTGTVFRGLVFRPHARRWSAGSGGREHIATTRIVPRNGQPAGLYESDGHDRPT